MDFKKLESMLPDAYKLIIIALIATALVNGSGFGYDKVVLSAAVAVIAAQVFDIGLTYVKAKKVIVGDSATITALIITNIVLPGQFLLIGAASAAAVVLKHLIRFEKKPVFNPASSGLFIALLGLGALGTNALEGVIGWGNGTTDNVIATLVIVVLGSLVAFRIRRFAASATYLVANTALFYAMVGAAAFVYIPFFGAFFMYTEPRTTPVKTKHQIIFGITPLALAMVYGTVGSMIGIMGLEAQFYSFSLAFLSANVLKIGLEKWKI
jgi:Na+-translocating ferredoxin:NAD+ oxidoreductase RnfD subunit